jgi:hypothetical protein
MFHSICFFVHNITGTSNVLAEKVANNTLILQSFVELLQRNNTLDREIMEEVVVILK